jgi:endonuclease/exonuclease/phosphatase family metal-dependent hydrolase
MRRVATWIRSGTQGYHSGKFMTTPHSPVSRGRRFTPGRISIFLIIVIGLFLWQGNQKIPLGPAAGTTLNQPARPTSQPSGDILRVATFNIDGKDDDAIADTMKNLDFIGIEEVHGKGPLSSRNEAGTLGEKLGLQWLFAPVERQWWNDAFGDGVLTSLPIEHWQRFPLANENSESNRQILVLRLTFEGKPLNVLITHLDRRADHDEELRSAIALFLSLEAPVIFMGDLNTDRDDAQLKTLRKISGVIDPIGDIAESKSGGSYDRIFARGFKSLDAGFIDKGASDHPLAWANLQLNIQSKNP